MRDRTIPLGFLVLLVTSGAPSAFAADALPSTGANTTFCSSVRPILAARCFPCHAGKTPKAGPDLSRFAGDEDEVTGAFRLWEKVIRKVDAGEMPPDGEEPMTDL
jgi:hypothetical protein